MEQNSSETIQNLPSIRENYDIFKLAEQVKKHGDTLKLANNLNINYSSLKRAVEEARILSICPDIHKAKANPLSRLKTQKERQIFLKRYDLKNIKCRDLYKLVKTWRTLIENNPRILLTEKQHDLIIGTMLGDGSIKKRNKNCSLHLCHSTKQKEYLQSKYKTLKEFTNLPPHKVAKEIKGNKWEDIEFESFTHSVFNYYHKLFYKNRRKTITRKLLNMLTPRSLAIWICDDGSFGTKQTYIILCTNSFTLEEHKIIKKYFEEVWDLSPTIGFRDKKYYYLRFKKEDTKKLVKIISPFILRSMKHKIGEK